MRLMRRTWTDSRMDDLNAKVDRLDSRVDRLEVEMRAGFARVDQRLDRLIFLLFGLLATGSAAVVTAVVTHL
jgi:tetrahydromethanopterin S-methyltransferase subunit G